MTRNVTVRKPEPVALAASWGTIDAQLVDDTYPNEIESLAADHFSLGANPTDYDITVENSGGGTLVPSVVSYDQPTDILTVNSDPGGQSVFMRAQTTAEADWQSRIAGAFYSENFDYADQAAFEAARADVGVDNPPRRVLDTANQLTGNGCCRINWIAADGDHTESANWAFSFDGAGEQTFNARKQQFYFQWSQRMDANVLGYQYSGGAVKQIILYNPSVGQATNGELVTSRDGPNPDLIYHLRWGSSGLLQTGVNISAPALHSGTVVYHTDDKGAQSESGETDLTDTDLFARRFGPNHRNLAAGTYATNPDYANHFHHEAEKWYVFMLYVDLPGQIQKLWGAERGQAPQLITATFDADMNASNSEIYAGGNLLNRNEGAGGVWPTSDGHLLYDEIIASDAAIQFPGDFDAPLLGSAAVPGFPPSTGGYSSVWRA